MSILYKELLYAVTKASLYIEGPRPPGNKTLIIVHEQSLFESLLDMVGGSRHIRRDGILVWIISGDSALHFIEDLWCIPSFRYKKGEFAAPIYAKAKGMPLDKALFYLNENFLILKERSDR